MKESSSVGTSASIETWRCSGVPASGTRGRLQLHAPLRVAHASRTGCHGSCMAVPSLRSARVCRCPSLAAASGIQVFKQCRMPLLFFFWRAADPAALCTSIDIAQVGPGGRRHAKPLRLNITVDAKVCAGACDANDGVERVSARMVYGILCGHGRTASGTIYIGPAVRPQAASPDPKQP